MRDVFREAAFLGLPFRWPRPDPVQNLNGDYRIPQPHIHRLTHLGVAAAERGRGLAVPARRSATSSGAARPRAGTKATIWLGPLNAPGWT